MSADSLRKQSKQGYHGQVILPQPINDLSLIESVAGFIHEVVPQAYSSVLPGDSKDGILWARFDSTDYNDPENFPQLSECESESTPPLLLVLGYSSGVQVWSVGGSGEATELLSWCQGAVRALRFLLRPASRDPHSSKRPLVAIVDSSSAGPQFATLSFISLKTAEVVKIIKFNSAICDVHCNRKSIVVTFSERIAVFDSATLEDRLTITTCYPSPGNSPNPIALGPRWLAYGEKRLTTWQRSSGGCEGDGAQSYTSTVIHAAKSLGKGLRELGGTLTGSTTQTSHSPQTQPGVVSIIDIERKCSTSEEEKGNMIAHFVAHTSAVVAMVFDPSGLLLVTADRHGHRFNVFRIHSHPCTAQLAAVHHLYILHRGETTARVQDLAVSWDSRWVAVSSVRGTTHVFPITPYGSLVTVRTHTTSHVVNKLSRFERSAGLRDGRGSPLPCEAPPTPPPPRLPPYPHPSVVTPLAQLRARPDDAPLAAFFAPPRAWLPGRPKSKRTCADSLYIIYTSGAFLQYDLDPKVLQGVVKEKLSFDTPIELGIEGKAEWILPKPPYTSSLCPPLPSGHVLLDLPPRPHQPPDKWLSQVEIVTHTGPHRRLWMGPQFLFKSIDPLPMSGGEGESGGGESGNPLRSNPVNMPHRPFLLVEIGSGYDELSLPSPKSLCLSLDGPMSCHSEKGGKDSFTLKSTTRGIILYPANPVAYRTFVHVLRDGGCEFHTYQLSDDKLPTVVIRGLHPDTPIEEIKSDLAAKGINTVKITNALDRFKRHIPLFFIQVDKNTFSEKIYEITYLCQSRVQVEEPRKKREIGQCSRCLGFSHTKSYCNLPHRCIRCGGQHESGACEKPANVPATCANCGEAHPANYRGCSTLKKLRKEKSQRRGLLEDPTTSRPRPPFTPNPSEFPLLPEIQGLPMFQQQPLPRQQLPPRRIQVNQTIGPQGNPNLPSQDIVAPPRKQNNPAAKTQTIPAPKTQNIVGLKTQNISAVEAQPNPSTRRHQDFRHSTPPYPNQQTPVNESAHPMGPPPPLSAILAGSPQMTELDEAGGRLREDLADAMLETQNASGQARGRLRRAEVEWQVNPLGAVQTHPKALSHWPHPIFFQQYSQEHYKPSQQHQLSTEEKVEAALERIKLQERTSDPGPSSEEDSVRVSKSMTTEEPLEQIMEHGKGSQVSKRITSLCTASNPLEKTVSSTDLADKDRPLGEPEIVECKPKISTAKEIDTNVCNTLKKGLKPEGFNIDSTCADKPLTKQDTEEKPKSGKKGRKKRNGNDKKSKKDQPKVSCEETSLTAIICDVNPTTEQENMEEFVASASSENKSENSKEILESVDELRGNTDVHQLPEDIAVEDNPEPSMNCDDQDVLFPYVSGTQSIIACGVIEITEDISLMDDENDIPPFNESLEIEVSAEPCLERLDVMELRSMAEADLPEILPEETDAPLDPPFREVPLEKSPGLSIGMALLEEELPLPPLTFSIDTPINTIPETLEISSSDQEKDLNGNDTSNQIIEQVQLADIKSSESIDAVVTSHEDLTSSIDIPISKEIENVSVIEQESEEFITVPSKSARNKNRRKKKEKKQEETSQTEFSELESSESVVILKEQDSPIDFPVEEHLPLEPDSVCSLLPAVENLLIDTSSHIKDDVSEENVILVPMEKFTLEEEVLPMEIKSSMEDSLKSTSLDATSSVLLSDDIQSDQIASTDKSEVEDISSHSGKESDDSKTDRKERSRKQKRSESSDKDRAELKKKSPSPAPGKSDPSKDSESSDEASRVGENKQCTPKGGKRKKGKKSEEEECIMGEANAMVARRRPISERRTGKGNTDQPNNGIEDRDSVYESCNDDGASDSLAFESSKEDFDDGSAKTTVTEPSSSNTEDKNDSNDKNIQPLKKMRKQKKKKR